MTNLLTPGDQMERIANSVPVHEFIEITEAKGFLLNISISVVCLCFYLDGYVVMHCAWCISN